MHIFISMDVKKPSQTQVVYDLFRVGVGVKLPLTTPLLDLCPDSQQHL